MSIELEPIGFVRGGRTDFAQDDWGGERATIELDANRFSPESVMGLESFSHLVVVFQFHRVSEENIQLGARRPRNNAAWPEVGIFAQRARIRPNRIGVSTCRILSIDGVRVDVQGLDALDGTPVLDIKPYMTGFDPREPVEEPDWAKEIMSEYWDR